MFVFLVLMVGAICLAGSCVPGRALPLPPHYRQRHGCRRDRNPQWMAPLLVILAGTLVVVGLRGIGTSAGARLHSLPGRMARNFEVGVIGQAPQTNPEAQSSATTDPGPAWKIVGKGKTAADAEEDALDRARDEVILYLRSQNPAIDWTPPLPFIKENLVKATVREAPQEIPRCEEFPDGLVSQVSIQLQVKPETRAEMMRLDRQERMQKRLFFLAELLGGVVVFLLALAGYIHLEDWSKGCCTRRLRIAAVGLLAVTGAGWWLLN